MSITITEETLPNKFIAHSLDDTIFEFESNAAHGAVFYLPEGPDLGGDSFIIYYDEFVTAAVLNDFKDKRAAARRHINATHDLFLKVLDKLVHSKKLDDLPALLYDLDKQLIDLSTQTALTILRIPDEEVLYFNGGENFLMYYDSHADALHTKEKLWPKLGIFSRHISKDKFMEKFNANLMHCAHGDKLILCTDGVSDLNPIQPGNRTFLEKSVRSVIRENPKQMISLLNQEAKKYLPLYTLDADQNVPDDYTLLVLELK